MSTHEKPPVQVRRYLPKDIEAIKGLLQDLARLYNDDFNEYFFNNSMQMRLLDTSMGTFIADNGDHVCGCAFADLERDPRGVLFGRISNINVVGDCQGHGVGSVLVDEAIQFLSVMNVPSIWANVNPNNEAMLKMFERRDFTKMLKVMEKDIDSFSSKTDSESNQDASNIKYRSSTEKDLPEIKKLIQALSEIFNEPFEPYWFDLTIQKYLQVPSSQMFVAVDGSKIVGVSFAEVRKDPLGNSYGYISNVIVNDSYRSKGLGTHLITQASAFLQNLNMKQIWANVNENSEGMRKLFEKHGFTHKFTVMVKKLNMDAAC